MIDLLLVGQATDVHWRHGQVIRGGSTVATMVESLSTWLTTSPADALLAWDARLPLPEISLLETLLARRGDVWHAGLLLGTQGQPGLIDFVAPTWMLNCDADPELESTSWRVTFAACLVRTDVFRQLGLPRPEFETVPGAVYEWGHRAIKRGALVRHVPRLVDVASIADHNWAAVNTPSIGDEVRLVANRYGHFWARWAIGRAALTRYASPSELLRAYNKVARRRPYDEPAPYRSARSFGEPDLKAARVTVLIPTLDRYPYLRVVLDNLRAQTVRPHEIVIIDQSAREKRDLAIAKDFADLPLHLMYQDEPGQCASRNAGLAASSGDFILFIDDDDELGPTLIEEHLRNLARFDADVSSGVAQEVGTSALDPADRFVRASDVFPTNNTLVRREVLLRSGLFDLAFNRAPRADGELGMRVYLSGSFMVLDQGIAVMHHHAAEGGLRAHRARVITYRASREQLTKRHLMHTSEIYLASRYFSHRQVREVMWLRTVGTLSGRGSGFRRVAKALVGSAMLPDTIAKTLERRRMADEWLTRFPQIARLES